MKIPFDLVGFVRASFPSLSHLATQNAKLENSEMKAYIEKYPTPSYQIGPNEVLNELPSLSIN